MKIRLRKRGLGKYGSRIETDDRSAIEVGEEENPEYEGDPEIPIGEYSVEGTGKGPQLTDEELKGVKDELDLSPEED